MSAILITSLSGASTRQAVVEESAASVWLYMTGPRGEPPIAGCFLCNTGNSWTPSTEEPPPLDEALASSNRVQFPVHDDDVQIIWSAAGDAVAVRIHGEYVGFIDSTDLRGYSRSVSQDCDWAHPFDVELFKRLFEMA